MGKIYADTVDNETEAATIITAATNDSITFTRAALHLAGGHNGHVLRLGRVTTVAIDGQLYADDGATIFGTAPGSSNTIRIYVGTAAHDADDRIIFNPSTHALYYDADGAGGAAQAQFAVINGTDVPTASDIIATTF